jgi:hypothetical protein
MELADVLDSKSSAFGRAGSTPATGTKKQIQLDYSVWLGLLFYLIKVEAKALEYSR